MVPLSQNILSIFGALVSGAASASETAAGVGAGGALISRVQSPADRPDCHPLLRSYETPRVDNDAAFGKLETARQTAVINRDQIHRFVVGTFRFFVN